MPNKNSVTYLTHHEFLHNEVVTFKKIAESIESPFGMFLADLLMEILNISVGEETKENRPFLNYQKNEDARLKEMKEEVFIVRREFGQPLLRMKINAVRARAHSLLWYEEVLMERFVLFIDQFNAGTLYPQRILDEICVLHQLTASE